MFQAAILPAPALAIVDSSRSIFTLAALHPVRGDGSVLSDVSESLRVRRMQLCGRILSLAASCLTSKKHNGTTQRTHFAHREPRSMLFPALLTRLSPVAAIFIFSGSGAAQSLLAIIKSCTQEKTSIFL